MNQNNRKDYLKRLLSCETNVSLLIDESINTIEKDIEKCSSKQEIKNLLTENLEAIEEDIQGEIEESLEYVCDLLIKEDQTDSKEILDKEALALLLLLLMRKKKKVIDSLVTGEAYVDKLDLKTRISAGIKRMINKVMKQLNVLEDPDIEILKSITLNTIKHKRFSFDMRRTSSTHINHAAYLITKEIMESDPYILGGKWNLSPSHPRYDICDEYAERDEYNLGRGVYPIGALPNMPHPFCLCYITYVRVETEESKADFDKNKKEIKLKLSNN